MPVDVRTVQRYRRKLRFEDYGELLTDARHLVELIEARGEAARQYDESGNPLPSTAGVEYLANMNTGQSLKHLAIWLDASIDGTPMEPPPWIVRVFARMMKGKLLNEPVMPGFKLSSKGDAHFVPAAGISAADGLAALKAGIERLAKTSERADSLLLGALSGSEWDRLHLRHAELHLSYILPHEG